MDSCGDGVAILSAARAASTVASGLGVGAGIAAGVGDGVGAGVGLAVQAVSAAARIRMGKAIRRIRAGKAELPVAYDVGALLQPPIPQLGVPGARIRAP